MSVFYISDTHYEHKNIIAYQNRPFKNIYEMERGMIEAWNSVVTKSDTVWHIGDFSMTSDPADVRRVLKLLHGTKHLIRGNHDYLNHKQYIECGFKSSQASWRLNDQGHKLHLHHKPVTIPKDYDWQIHGHIHSGDWKPISDRHINVCVDVIGYVPRRITELVGYRW